MAEVLITLGIIGVVAAMTMPSLMANHKEKETIVKLKKIYSVMSQAYLSAVDANGTPDNWNLIGVSSYEGAANMRNTMKPYLNVVSQLFYQIIDQNCNTNRGNGGSLPLTKVCAAFGVDINGLKPPNKNGRDIFQFYITKNTIVPYGTKDEIPWIFPRNCTKEGSPSGNYGCTAWVLVNENMEYLKCGDLSWGGKTKCGN